MTETFFPYKVFSGDFLLSINEVEVDSAAPSPNPFEPEAREIHLYDQEKADWSSFQLTAELQGPAEEIRGFVGRNELAATLMLTCDATKERRSVPLKGAGSDSSKWTGLIDIERAYLRGEVSIQAIVSGPAGGLPHRFLARSTAWTVFVDEPVISHRRGSIKVKWVDFTAKDAPVILGDFSEEPFYADLSDENPILYLNKSAEYERLPVILDDRRRHGQDLALHNAERMGIARAVWMAMLNASIAGIKEGEEGADPDWPDVKWQQRVLKVLLPKIYRNQHEAEALKSAYAASQSPSAAAMLESRALSEINLRIESAKHLKRALELP